MSANEFLFVCLFLLVTTKGFLVVYGGILKATEGLFLIDTLLKGFFTREYLLGNKNFIYLVIHWTMFTQCLLYPRLYVLWKTAFLGPIDGWRKDTTKTYADRTCCTRAWSNIPYNRSIRFRPHKWALVQKGRIARKWKAYGKKLCCVLYLASPSVLCSKMLSSQPS